MLSVKYGCLLNCLIVLAVCKEFTITDKHHNMRVKNVTILLLKYNNILLFSYMSIVNSDNTVSPNTRCLQDDPGVV